MGGTGGGGVGAARRGNQCCQVVAAQAEIGSWKKAATPAKVTSASKVRRLSCHQRSRGRAADFIVVNTEFDNRIENASQRPPRLDDIPGGGDFNEVETPQNQGYLGSFHVSQTLAFLGSMRYM